MFAIISSIFFLIIYLMGPYSHHKLLIKNQEFAINHLIKLDKNYKIKINTIEGGEFGIVRDVRLYKNEREIDLEIIQYKEFNFSYYFQGKHGYYILNKLTKILITHKELNSFKRLQVKKFEKYFM